MKKYLFVFGAIVFLLSFRFVLAQDDLNGTVDYKDGLVVDRDLDGLTDEGEMQLFHTNPAEPDSDGDGIYDGAEILNKADPANINDPVATKVISSLTYPEETETPWAWYLSRASGLIGFLLFFISIFLGLAIRTPGLNKIIAPINSLGIHSWISLQALIFAAIHGLSLSFDKFLGFNLGNILIPFYPLTESQLLVITNPILLAFGVLGFYFMLALVLTSYFRKHINYQAWRAIHFLNIGLYVIAIIHALYLGTDLKDGILRSVFIYANIFLVSLFVFSLIFRLRKAMLKKFPAAQ